LKLLHLAETLKFELIIRDCAIITWRGVGKPEGGGIGENPN